MERRRYFPIEYDVQGRRAAIVGADASVEDKVVRLLDAGAEVVVYACGQAVASALAERARAGLIVLVETTPDEEALREACVIFVAPAHEELARELVAWARHGGRLLCTLDRPERSTFVNPAVFEASGVGMRIVSGGVSPGLVRRLREDLEALLSDPRLERFLERLGALRQAQPRGRRAAAMQAAVRGFGLAGALRFPAWFEGGGEPPPS